MSPPTVGLVACDQTGYQKSHDACMLTLASLLGRGHARDDIRSDPAQGAARG